MDDELRTFDGKSKDEWMEKTLNTLVLSTKTIIETLEEMKEGWSEVTIMEKINGGAKPRNIPRADFEQEQHDKPRMGEVRKIVDKRMWQIFRWSLGIIITIGSVVTAIKIVLGGG